MRFFEAHFMGLAKFASGGELMDFNPPVQPLLDVVSRIENKRSHLSWITNPQNLRYVPPSTSQRTQELG